MSREEPPHKKAKTEDKRTLDRTLSSVLAEEEGKEVDVSQIEDVQYFTGIRSGKVFFHEERPQLMQRNPWSLHEVCKQPKYAHLRHCKVEVKDNQLFLTSALGSKLPGHFSYVDGLERKLAGCARPELGDIEGFARLDAGLLISLSEESTDYFDMIDQTCQKYGIRHIRHPTVNGGAPAVWDIDTLVEAVHECIQEGKLAIAHCHAGEGRTGTILASYLVKYLGQSHEESVRTLRRTRHRALQGWDPRNESYYDNEVQMNQLRVYVGWLAEKGEGAPGAAAASAAQAKVKKLSVLKPKRPGQK